MSHGSVANNRLMDEHVPMSTIQVGRILLAVGGILFTISAILLAIVGGSLLYPRALILGCVGVAIGFTAASGGVEYLLLRGQEHRPRMAKEVVRALPVAASVSILIVLGVETFAERTSDHRNFIAMLAIPVFVGSYLTYLVPRLAHHLWLSAPDTTGRT